MNFKIEEKIYAGILGKIIGVYFGRPVEGWSYEKIKKKFGEINYYVNDSLNVPIIVPDDDISGTFAFVRAIEDHNFPKYIQPKAIGKTWLNYIIEEKTILWWGGLGRSTEHTAFLNLKNGIDAPESGSHKINGDWIPEQIGAQIFIDGFAMSTPGDPDLAAKNVRAAASVSHDGIALDAAVLLGTMESMAFYEKDKDKLLDRGLSYVKDKHLLNVVEKLRNECAKTNDWHKVRHWIAKNYGYKHYEGPCHVVPNHLIVLMSFLLGGDDFYRSLTIATSAGWDTDCNAGNVGCLNGIRLGLKIFDEGPDLRGPVADLMYIVTADGGECISDAVREAQKISGIADVLTNSEKSYIKPRYNFKYYASTQGFTPCPNQKSPPGVIAVENVNDEEGGLSVKIFGVTQGITGSISSPVFMEPEAVRSNFGMQVSPSLYSGQTVISKIESTINVKLRFFVLYYDLNDQICSISGEWNKLVPGLSELRWVVPSTKGLPIYRIGIELGNKNRIDGEVIIRSIDWKGAPDYFEIKGMLMESIWKLKPMWLRAWVSSAKHFAPDFKWTLCCSHPEKNGVVTIGTRDWDNYSVSSSLDYSINDGGGLIIRARGHQRYYAGILKDKQAIILKNYDGEKTILSNISVPNGAKGKRDLNLKVVDNKISLVVDGKEVGLAEDDSFSSGGAGFFVEKGTILADGFLVQKT